MKFLYINFDNEYIKISIIFLLNNIIEIKIKIPNKPGKAKLVELNRILEQLKNDELIIENKFKVNIDNINIKLTSSFIQKIIKEIQSYIKRVIREEEKLPELSQDIIDAISYKTESLHGAGSPQAQRIMIARQGNLMEKVNLVKKILEIT